jgi:CheY-like chemotaxis protein
MDQQRTVLIVESDAEERERLGTILEVAGYDVVICSGPTGPDYVCIGARESRCPLVGGSDVVVLDLWLESDTLMMGTPSNELLQLYLSAGKAVITLGRDRGIALTPEDEPVVSLPRHPQPDELLRSVRACARSLPEGIDAPIGPSMVGRKARAHEGPRREGGGTERRG